MSQYKIKTIDNKEYNLDLDLINKINLLTNMIEDIDCFEEIPINITSKDLNYIIQFYTILNKLNIDKDQELYQTELIKTFFSSLNNNDLFDLVNSSNFLDFSILLDELCKTIAFQIKECKNAKEICTRFDIPYNDSLEIH